MTTPTPWLGTEPEEVSAIELDEDVWEQLRWHERLGVLCPCQITLIDRVCGPEYRMWEEQR